MFQNFLNLFTNPFADPATRWTVAITVGSILLIAALLWSLRRLKLDTKTLVVASLTIAIAFVLSYLKFFSMPQSGSITPGSMLPIMMFAWFYGTLPGIAVGLAFGLLQLLLGATVVHPIQFFMDYMLAFMVLGFAGLFKKSLNLGIIITGLARTAVHIISGFVFFAAYAGDQNPIIYSILYNATYLLPEIIICLIIYNIPSFKSNINKLYKPSQPLKR